MLKPEENPPILSPLAGSVTELNGCWWVAHARSRFEKAFAWDLVRLGIGYILPMIERIRMSGGRKRRVILPLFPSYVFFCGTEEDRCAAMGTNRLCKTIDVGDQTGLVAELSAIERALAGKAELDPYPFAVVGRTCRVAAGPLRGVEGVVVRRDRSTRLVLQVSMLGQGVSMEIDADLLEAAE